MKTYQVTIERLKADQACAEGIAYAQHLLDNNLPVFETCVKEGQHAYASWLMENMYVEATDANREPVLAYPILTYRYALRVDRGPSDVTRNAVLSDPRVTYLYASFVDRGVREDTKNAVAGSEWFAYAYAKNVGRN